MKKPLYTILILIAVLTSSCNNDEDYTDPNVLSGTTWRCDNISDIPEFSSYDYYEYKFISKDSVQTWEKKKADTIASKVNTIFYIVHDCTLTLFRKKDNPLTSPYPTLTIGSNSLSFNVYNTNTKSTTTLNFYLYNRE